MLGLCYDCSQSIDLQNTFYDNKDYKNPIGVEIEFFTGRDDSYKLQRSFYPSGDGSISPPENCVDVEAKFCNDSTKIQKQTIDICNYIGTMSKSGVNSTCGLHVHLGIPKMSDEDERDRYAEEYRYRRAQLYDVFYPLQNLMEKAFGYRMNHARYIRKIASLREGLEKGIWVSQRENFSTVELRIHESTLNPVIMHDWLSACMSLQKLAHDAINGKNTSRVKAAKAGNLRGVLRKNSPGEKYLSKRIEFMSGHSNKFSYDSFSDFEEVYH